MADPRPTKLAIAGPTIGIRLSRRQIRTLQLGCSRIRHYVKKLVLSCDRELWERLQSLTDKVESMARSTKAAHRVRVDALSLCAFAFGLRGICAEVRRHPHPALSTEARVAARMLKQFEVLRKRAKRAWLKTESVESYVGWHKRWRRFTKSVQFDRRPVRIPSEKRMHYVRRLDQILANVKSLLKAGGEWVPLDGDLRPIVRAAVRHVTRERATVWIKDLLIPTRAGKEFLIEFVGGRVNRLLWKRFRELSARMRRDPEDDDDCDSTFNQVMEAARDQELLAAIRENRVPIAASNDQPPGAIARQQ